MAMIYLFGAVSLIFISNGIINAVRTQREGLKTAYFLTHIQILLGSVMFWITLAMLKNL